MQPKKMNNNFCKNKQTHTKTRSAFPPCSLGVSSSDSRGLRPTCKLSLQVYDLLIIKYLINLTVHFKVIAISLYFVV